MWSGPPSSWADNRATAMGEGGVHLPIASCGKPIRVVFWSVYIEL